MKHSIGYAVFAVLLHAMSLSAQTTAPIDQQKLLQLGRESEKLGVQKQLIDYPILPTAKLSDVVVLGMQNGHLTIRTALPPTTMPSRLPISDLNGICTITLRQVDTKPVGSPSTAPATAAALYEPDLFLLERYRFDEPNTTISSITVEALPQSVQLAWSAETLTGSYEGSMVEQVVQIGSGANLNPPNIILRANSQPRDGDASETQIELKSRDFQSLRREHPAEVEKYLAPIFHELRADAVMRQSDTVLAWQVFFAEAKPNPALAGAVVDGVKKLDSDDYSDRETAAKSLANLGPAVVVELSRLDRTKLSAEQISMVDGLIRKFHPVGPDVARRLIDDQAFLIACLADSDDFVASTALAHLRKMSGRPLNLDLSTHGQDRLDAVKHIREQLAQAGIAR